MSVTFQQRMARLIAVHQELLSRPNSLAEGRAGLLARFENPVLTRDHVPFSWRYDFDEAANLYLMERLSVNAVFNPAPSN